MSTSTKAAPRPKAAPKVSTAKQSEALRGVGLNESLAREIHWVRVLNRALGDLQQATTRIGRRMLRSAICSHVQTIRSLRDHIDELDELDGLHRTDLANNEMRALRAFAYWHGKQWRFTLARKWRAGQIGGTLKDLLDDPGFGGPQKLARVRLAAINHLHPANEPITKKRVDDRNDPAYRAERLHAWNSTRATAGKISHKAAILRAKRITDACGSDIWRRRPLAMAAAKPKPRTRAGSFRHMTTEQRAARLYGIVVQRWTAGVMHEVAAVHRGKRISKAKLAVEACISSAL